ncbi:MAG: hypothetical protein M1504_01830 [Candidatus Marsarchaeota archaeon]|nr:hypothetical protein [Candidatus Marsarchaeota archaeon]
MAEKSKEKRETGKTTDKTNVIVQKGGIPCLRSRHNKEGCCPNDNSCCT